MNSIINRWDRKANWGKGISGRVRDDVMMPRGAIFGRDPICAGDIWPYHLDRKGKKWEKVVDWFSSVVSWPVKVEKCETIWRRRRSHFGSLLSIPATAAEIETLFIETSKYLLKTWFLFHSKKRGKWFLIYTAMESIITTVVQYNRRLLARPMWLSFSFGRDRFGSRCQKHADYISEKKTKKKEKEEEKNENKWDDAQILEYRQKSPRFAFC